MAIYQEAEERTDTERLAEDLMTEFEELLDQATCVLSEGVGAPANILTRLPRSDALQLSMKEIVAIDAVFPRSINPRALPMR